MNIPNNNVSRINIPVMDTRDTGAGSVWQRLHQRSAAINRLLSVDFCPSFNGWVYWLKNPLWVLVLAVVGSVLCGWFLNPWIFALTALLLAVVGVGTVLPWVSMRGVSCEVMFDVRRIRFGEAALVRLRIRNRWPLPVWGLSLVNGFAVGSSGSNNVATHSDEGVAFARVPGWSTVEYTWPFVAKRRGLYPLNDVAEVETSFPFGIFHARRIAKVDGRLTVWPETIFLAQLPDAAESQQSDDSFSDRRVGDFGDVLGTRGFREGDSLRRVHWAQTARQQTLIVTERQAPMMSSVRIVLDLSPENHPEALRSATVEQSIRVAASLCDSLHRQHCRVELQIGDELIIVDNNQSGLQRAMDALAVAHVDDTSTTRTATTKPSSRRQGDFQIVITTAQGLQPQRPRQILVTANLTTDADDIVRHAWLCNSAAEPLSHLAAAWRKVVS